LVEALEPQRRQGGAGRKISRLLVEVRWCKDCRGTFPSEAEPQAGDHRWIPRHDGLPEIQPAPVEAKLQHLGRRQVPELNPWAKALAAFLHQLAQLAITAELARRCQKDGKVPGDGRGGGWGWGRGKGEGAHEGRAAGKLQPRNCNITLA
jgi:hypothetical protein